MDENQTPLSQNLEPQPHNQILQHVDQSPTPISHDTMQNTVNEDQQPLLASSTINNQIEQTTFKKASQWSYFFIVLGILQALGVAFSIWILMSRGDGSGSEADGAGKFFVVFFVFPILLIEALINLIGLTLYLKRHKPQGTGFILCLLSLTLSVVLILVPVAPGIIYLLK